MRLLFDRLFMYFILLHELDILFESLRLIRRMRSLGTFYEQVIGYQGYSLSSFHLINDNKLSK